MEIETHARTGYSGRPGCQAAQAALGCLRLLLGCYRHRAVINYREGGYKMDACWSIVLISNLPFSLTRSRREYLKVVGILEMVE